MHKTQMESAMFHGSMVALVTPMSSDDKTVDYDKFTQLLEWHINAGTEAIIVAGTTGESATLTAAEVEHMTRHAVNVVRERVPIIAGTGSNATQHAITLTDAALHAGADAALIMTPSYNRPTQEGLKLHYTAIADTVSIPIIMYNVPGRTGCDLLPETVAELAHRPNIIGIKEATGELQRCQEILQRCGSNLDVYSGDDATACAWMLAGAKGVISVTANVAPELMAQMCKAALAGDATAAQAIDARLQGLHKVLFTETNPIPVKWALAQMGLLSEAIRLPLTPLSEAARPEVLAQLQELALLPAA